MTKAALVKRARRLLDLPYHRWHVRASVSNGRSRIAVVRRDKHRKGILVAIWHDVSWRALCARLERVAAHDTE